MDDLRERLASLQVSAASADGLVRATVGPRGELIDLELDRAVYRSHDPDDLARLVVATARSAAARTAEQVEALLAGYLPPESDTLRYVKDNDLGSLLRRPDSIVRDA
jgi:DNA-binding protein YbaB